MVREEEDEREGFIPWNQDSCVFQGGYSSVTELEERLGWKQV